MLTRPSRARSPDMARSDIPGTLTVHLAPPLFPARLEGDGSDDSGGGGGSSGGTHGLGSAGGSGGRHGSGSDNSSPTGSNCDKMEDGEFLKATLSKSSRVRLAQTWVVNPTTSHQWTHVLGGVE